MLHETMPGKETTKQQKLRMSLLQEAQIQEFLDIEHEIQIFDSDYQCMRDTLEDYCISKIDEQFPLSTSSFPAITKIHTTGSRAEKLWIPKYSDEDTIYEIGPGLVYPKQQLLTSPTPMLQRPQGDLTATFNENRFFMEEAEHIGHYRITDSKGGYLYPQDLQMKLAPTFQYLELNKPKTINHRHGFHRGNRKNNSDSEWRYDDGHERTDAAVKLNDDHDHVIGLKVDQWPPSIKYQLTVKLKHGDAVKSRKILGEQLFLVPKSHPESKHHLVEWRLSFSFVERRILFNIPEYQKTAFLILKSKINCTAVAPTFECYKSYHLKTVLLELTTSQQFCSETTRSNAHCFTNALIEKLSNAYDQNELPNFFIPSQNLLENEHGEIKQLANMIRTLKKGRPEEICGISYYCKSPVTILSNIRTIADLPVIVDDISQNITLMFLTELYNDLRWRIQDAFKEATSLGQGNMIWRCGGVEMMKHLLAQQGNITTGTKPEERVLFSLLRQKRNIVSTVILIKRIVRLMHLQWMSFAKVNDDKLVGGSSNHTDTRLEQEVKPLTEGCEMLDVIFNQILEFNVICFEDYLCFVLFKQRGDRRLQTSNQATRDKDDKNYKFIFSGVCRKTFDTTVNRTNATNEARLANRFQQNLTLLLKFAISEKKIIQLITPEALNLSDKMFNWLAD